jgi:arylsulfatase A-like enzyme
MPRPNVLIFMTDQQRGSTILPESPAMTPNLDRFLAEGLVFTRARCPAPHCCPSRATFFSGLYPTEHGVWNNVGVQNALSRGPHPGTRMWSQALSESGYRCCFTGKWHVSDGEPPGDFGWEEHQPPRPAARPRPEPQRQRPGPQPKSRYPDWEPYYTNLARTRSQPQSVERPAGLILRPDYGDYQHYGVAENPFNDRGVVDCGLGLLRELGGSEAPWCLYVGTQGPHDPYCLPQEFIDRYRDQEIDLPPSYDDLMTDKPGLYRRCRDVFSQLTREEIREAIRHYLAFCSYEDALFGEMLAELERSGQADNTLVIYCSDHGDYLADHGLWCKGLPCFQGAYEIPLAVRWPAALQQPGRRVDAFVGLEDFARTLLDCCGLAAEDWPGSGRSLRPFLENREPDAWRSAHCTQSNGNELYGIQRSIETAEWKYVYNGFDYDELYDLVNDPHETRNLARDPAQAARVAELCARMWAFGYEHGEQSINPYIFTAVAPIGPASALDDQARPLPSGA